MGDERKLEIVEDIVAEFCEFLRVKKLNIVGLFILGETGRCV